MLSNGDGYPFGLRLFQDGKLLLDSPSSAFSHTKLHYFGEPKLVEFQSSQLGGWNKRIASKALYFHVLCILSICFLSTVAGCHEASLAPVGEGCENTGISLWYDGTSPTCYCFATPVMLPDPFTVTVTTGANGTSTPLNINPAWAGTRVMNYYGSGFTAGLTVGFNGRVDCMRSLPGGGTEVAPPTIFSCAQYFLGPPCGKHREAHFTVVAKCSW